MAIKLQEIHTSFLNGQKEQCVSMIIEYGIVDFVSDYKDFLDGRLPIQEAGNTYAMVIISFHRLFERITGRSKYV